MAMVLAVAVLMAVLSSAFASPAFFGIKAPFGHGGSSARSTSLVAESSTGARGASSSPLAGHVAQFRAFLADMEKSEHVDALRKEAEKLCGRAAAFPAQIQAFARKRAWAHEQGMEEGDKRQRAWQRGDIISRNSSSSRSSQLLRGGANAKKKVLILMSDTGGGHRASANALDKSLHEQFPGDIDVDIMDIWTDHANFPFNQFVPTYRYLAQRPALWRGFFAYGQFPPTKLFTETWSWMNSYKRFKAAIVASKPDLVVSVHPLCQLMPIWIVQEMNKIRDKSLPFIPFVTVVTDLGAAHATWFDKRADALFIPSNAVRRLALKNKINEKRIFARGLPIRPVFWQRGEGKDVLRKKLGLDTRYKTVMLMGGGDGVGGLDHIATAVTDKLGGSLPADTTTQIVVVCGKNKRIADKLESAAYPANIRVHVRGFVDNVHEYMGASDCLVTKAGPGTIAEAMTRGLPIVLSSFLPGQEAGNVPYVVDGGFGLYPGQRPKKIADAVYGLLSDEKRLHRMSVAARSAARPGATADIARDLGHIVLRETRKLPYLPAGADLTD